MCWLTREGGVIKRATTVANVIQARRRPVAQTILIIKTCQGLLQNFLGVLNRQLLHKLTGLSHTTPLLDKIGIIGGSYGGYMVLAALAFQPDAFSLGVDIFGVANWLRTLQSIPPWWEAYREALYKEMGNPETDEAYLRSISPLFHAGQISKPLLVLQGANDPRVLKVESDEIVEAVRQNNVPVEYIVFDDEGHGFSKKNNRITGYKAILTFLDQHFGREAGLEIEKDKQ